MFANTWTKAIVVVIVTITISKPTTGRLSDILSLGKGISSKCRYSACARFPVCRSGYKTVSKTSRGCSFSKQKKYCCQSDNEPVPSSTSQCLFTGCDRKTSCPRNYHELDRSRNGCSGSYDNTFCCQTTNLPYCFDLSCSATSQPAKVCPLEYSEVARDKGRLGGCESDLERVRCCFPEIGNGTTGNQSVNTNSSANGSEGFGSNAGFNQSVASSAVYSKNGTIKMENGRIQLVKKTQSYSKPRGSFYGALFGDASSLFARFSKTLLLFPILAALPAFRSKFI